MTTHALTRREWLAAAAGALALAATGRSAHALAAPAITIYKSPSCGCCAKWVDHMKAAGFATTVRDTEGMDAIKQRNGVPAAMQSCHTALVGGYVVEGHVPAADVLRLLREKPAGVRGLAVPGMPQSAPGMATPGQPIEPYDVMAFGATTRVFAKH